MVKNTFTSKKTSISEEILQSIKQVGGYGSVELIIQDNIVTQITVRRIKKTSFNKVTLDKALTLY